MKAQQLQKDRVKRNLLTLQDFLKKARMDLRECDHFMTELLFMHANARGTPIESLQADHVGYDCANASEFDHIRSLFEKAGCWMYQSIISGRRIAIIALPAVINLRVTGIPYLELADQKPDGSQKSEFTHIELYPVEPVPDLKHLAHTILHKTGIRFVPRELAHHTTIDHILENGFKLRIEPEPLIVKIKREEMQ